MILYLIRNEKKSKPARFEDIQSSNRATASNLTWFVQIGKKGVPGSRNKTEYEISSPDPHRIHGTGIFTYIWLNFIVNVQYMEPMGYIQQITSCNTLTVWCILLH